MTLQRLSFTAEVIEWRGPAPFYFLPVRDELVPALRKAAREASYGWGVVPVAARIGAIDFTTSLFPRGGTYLVPLKDKVRRATGVVVGDEVAIELRVELRR